jgi:hypothetical protein
VTSRSSRLETVLLTVVLVAIVTCTALVLRARSRHSSLSEFIRDASGAGGQGYAALVLFQPADCEHGLEFLRVFSGTPEAKKVRVSGALIASQEDAAYVATRLRDDGVAIPVRASPSWLVQEVRSLGYTATPVVMIADAEGRVRYAEQQPSEASDSALSAVIARLTDHH